MKNEKVWKKITIYFLSACGVYVLEQWVFPKLFNISLLKILLDIDGIYYAFAIGLINFGIGVYLFIRIKKISVINKENYIGFSKTSEEETRVIKPEHRAILEILIIQDNYSEYRRRLLEKIRNVNSQISELEFGLNLKEMQRLGYITQGTNQLGAFVTITDKACEDLARPGHVSGGH